MKKQDHQNAALAGCVPVLVTPLNSDRSIDFDSTDRLIGYYIDEGVGALWVLGTGGEDMALMYQHRLEFARHVARKFGDKIKLLVGCSFYSFEETLEFVDSLNELNLHGIHYMPYQMLMGLDAIAANYQEIGRRSVHPVWLYQSDNWGRQLPPSFLGIFAGDDAFAGCKYSTSNSVKFEQAFRYNRAGFQVIPAVVKQLLPALSLGAEAFTTVEASIHLERMKDILRAFDEGDIPAARTAQVKLNTLMEKLSCQAAAQNFLKVAEIKAILERKGICQRWVCSGFVELTDSEAEQIWEIYRSEET